MILGEDTLVSPELKHRETESASRRWIFFLSCGALFALPLGTSPYTILGACSLALCVFSGEFLKGSRFYLHSPWFLPVLCAVALVWFGLIWSCEPWNQGLEYARKSHYWLYALPVASVAPLISRKDHLIWAFLAGLFVNSLVGFLQLGGTLLGYSRWGMKGGFTGLCSGYNTLGILLVLGIMVASFYYGRASGKREKSLFGILMSAYFGHLMILEGRGAYLTFLLLSPLVFRNVLRGRKAWVVFLASMLAAGVLFSSPIVQNRVSRMSSDLRHHLNSHPEERWGKKYSNHQDRFYMWRWAAALFLDHPLLGIGTGGYRQAVLSGGGEVGVDHPHSNFLYVASSFGIVGLGVFGWLFWVLLRAGWRNRDRPMGFFVGSSGLVLLIGGITDTHLLDSGGAFLLSITAGLTTCLSEPSSPEGRGPLRHGLEGASAVRLPFFRKTLYGYLFREIWPTLVATLVTFIFIVLAARVLSISEWVINHGVPATDVGKIVLYMIPGMVLFALPAAVLMAVFVAFLRLSSDNEIMAFKSCGISLYQMLPPVVAVSLIGCLLGISISVFLIPWGNRSLKDLVFRIARSKADLGIKERVFSEPFDRLTFYVSSYSSKDKVMRDLFLVDRRDPSVSTTIVAKEGTVRTHPEGKVLVIHLLDGTAFTMEKKSQEARTIHFSSYDVTLSLEEMMPSDSLRKKSPQEMYVGELIRNLKAGLENTARYNDMAVELMGRFSIPLAVFLMGLIGAPLGSQIRLGGRSLGMGVSLLIFMAYYLFLAGVRSIGETGAISPFFGMWLPVLFLLVSCGVLLKRAQNERTIQILSRFGR